MWWGVFCRAGIVVAAEKASTALHSLIRESEPHIGSKRREEGAPLLAAKAAKAAKPKN
jgi:hypothetical protein